MPQNAFFSTNSRSSDQPKNDTKTPSSFFTLHPLSTVIFATATVLSFVLLRSSRFNFPCYTHLEAIVPEVTLRPLATSCAKDYKGHSCKPASPNRPIAVSVCNVLSDQCHWQDHPVPALLGNTGMVPPSNVQPTRLPAAKSSPWWKQERRQLVFWDRLPQTVGEVGILDTCLTLPATIV